MGTGGKALFYVTPHTVGALIETVSTAEKSGVAYAVIGNATNILFSDNGFDGAIVSTVKINGIELCKDGIYTECGAPLPRLSSFALENGFTGFEGLVSIPATVGGALISNAGAFGCEAADNLLFFSVYLPKEDRVEVRTPSTYPFSYRKSNATEGGAILLSALFKANAGDTGVIYAKMTENKEKRRASQPIGARSVGSFFKRPDYTLENKGALPDFYGKSAAELIDLCGLKGERVGGAEVSKKHAGFIINSDNATTKEVVALADKVRQTVFEMTGVVLNEECVILSDNVKK